MYKEFYYANENEGTELIDMLEKKTSDMDINLKKTVN